MSTTFLRFALLLALALPLAAQEFRATVFGVISDPTGAAIPAATIAVRNQTTNQVFTAKSNERGQYSIPFLNPGNYFLEAEAAGFKKLIYEKPIELRISDRMALNLSLDVGQVTDSVTVTAEADQIETGTASMGQVLDTRKVQDLPLNGRQIYQFLQLAPGVMFTVQTFGASGWGGTRPFGVGNNWVINGGYGNNEFLLDGAPNSVRGRFNISPTVDAVEEFKVMTNTYDAQYGRTSGGIVNMTLKSGTNQLHGSLFEYLRNSVMDANRFENNLKGLGKGSEATNDFGGMVSGPIRRNSTFFMFSYDGIRAKTPYPTTASIPTALERMGDFSASGLSIFDPMSTRDNPAFDPAKAESATNPRYVRDQFPGNRIPQTRINPVAKNVLAFMPDPNLPGRFNNYLASPNNGTDVYNSYITRVDHTLTPRNRVFGSYVFWHRDQLRNSNGLPGVLLRGDYMLQRTVNAVVVDWVSTLNASTVYNLRVSGNRYIENGDRRQNLDLDFSKLGFARNFTAPTTSRQMMPQFSPNRYTSFGQNDIYANPDNTYALQTNLSKIFGRHVAKFGMETRVLQSGRTNMGQPAGQFSFNEGFTQKDPQRSDAFSGNSIASMLLGFPSSGTINYNDSLFHSWRVWVLYAQDDWRVSKRLTLNLGLRWDIEESLRERFNRVNAGFDYATISPINDEVRAAYATIYPNIKDKRDLPTPDQFVMRGGLLFAGVGGSPREPYNSYLKTVQPRFGLAYMINSKTVIRAGIGSYYYQSTQFNSSNGFQQSTNYITNSGQVGVPETSLNTLVDPFPRGIARPAGSSLGLLTNLGQSPGFDYPDRKLPRVVQFSFGFQRDLPSRANLDISYVGSRTHNSFTSQNINDIPLWAQLKGVEDTTYLSRQIPNPFLGIAPATTSLGSQATIGPAAFLRAFPQFGSFSRGAMNDGKLWYNALQVKVDKRLANGLSAILSYTFSRMMEQTAYKNNWAWDGKPTRAPADIDTPHNLAFSGLYELPVGPNKFLLAGVTNLAARKLLSNWQVQWVFTYYSGRPIAITGAEYSGVPLKGVNHQWVTTPSGSPVLTWFNTYNIGKDGSYSAGTGLPKTLEEAVAIGSPFYQRKPNQPSGAPLRLSALRAATVPQLNLSVIKDTKLAGERMTLQFRAESFNFTNSPLLYGPTTDVNNRELFGTVRAAQQQFPRNVQLGLKLLF